MLWRKCKKHGALSDTGRLTTSQLHALRRLRLAITAVAETMERRIMLSVSDTTIAGAYVTPGAEFVYSVTDSGDSTTVNETDTVNVVGPETAPDGQSAIEVDRTTTTSANSDEEEDDDYYGFSTAGIVQFAEVDSIIRVGDPVSTSTDDDSPPKLILPASLSPGQTVTLTYTEDESVDDDGGVHTETDQITLVSDTPTSITVPAGTFNAYELMIQTNSTTTVPGDPSEDSSSNSGGEEYYAPKIGLIEVNATVDEGGLNGTENEVLTSYTTPNDTLQFAATPENTNAGDTIPAFSVDILNPDGQIDTQSNADVTLFLRGESGTLLGTTTVAAVDGIATFNDLSINAAGQFSLTAISSAANTNATSNTFQIGGDELVFTTEPDDSQLNAAIPTVVTVENSDGTTDTSADGTVDLTLNTIQDGVGAELGGTVTADLVDGVATFTNAAGPAINVAGTYTLSASLNDSTTDATDATSDSFTVSNSLIWTGGGDGINWSDPDNWAQDQAPVNGDSLLFPTGAPLTSNDDIAGLSIATIDIQGGGYTLTGDPISLTGGLTSESGNNTYEIDTTLVGSPTIDDQTGDFSIDSDLSGGGLTFSGDGTFALDQNDGYSGNTTVDSGVTIDIDSSDAFGTGTLELDGGTLDNDSGGGETIGNPFTMDGDVTVSTGDSGGYLAFDGDGTIGGASDLSLSGSGPVVLDSIGGGEGLSGSGPDLTISGSGPADLADIDASVSLENGESGSGPGETPDEIGGALDSGGSVTVDGPDTTVQLSSSPNEFFAAFSGDGSISVESGTLETGIGDVTGFSGSVTLDSGGTLDDADSAGSAGLGSGPLTLDGGTIDSIGFSGSSGGGETIGNPFTMDGDVTVSTGDSGGYLAFDGDGTIGGASDLSLSGSGPVVLDSIGGGEGLSGSGPDLTISGSGPADLADIDASVSLENGESGSGPGETPDEIGGALDSGGSVTVDGPDTTVQLSSSPNEFFAAFSGDGSISVESGTLETGIGDVTGFSGSVTLDSGGTLDDADSAGSAGLGSGPLTLDGGTIDSIGFSGSSGGGETIGNPFTMDGDVTVSTGDSGGYLAFDGDGTIGGASDLSLSGSGPVVLDSIGGGEGLSGSGPDLTISGSGPADLADIDASVSLENGESGSGPGETPDEIGGALDSGGSVTVDGPDTTVQLSSSPNEFFAAFSGDGSISVESGTLETGIGDVTGFSGSVTLDSGGTLDDADSAGSAGLGSGPLTLDGGTIDSIGFSGSSGGGETIGNPFTMDGDVTVSTGDSGGYLAFDGDGTIGGASDLSLSGSGPVVLDSIGGGEGLSGSGPDLTISGSGPADLADIDASVSLENGESGSGPGETPDEIGGALDSGGSVTVDGPDTTVQLSSSPNEFFAAFSGDGSISVESGTLETGIGDVTGFSGSVTLDSGGTLDDADSAGSAGLGSGPLTLDGGELENISGATAILSDPIVINGDVTISSSVARLKLSDNLDISGTGTLTVDGDLALTGTLTGSGAIIFNGGELAVANSNPTFSGKITLQSGTVEVVQNDALGTGSVIVDTGGDVTIESVSSIGDPVLDNPFTVEAGTLILDGQFTFPQGIVVDPGATLEITGSGTAVNVSGPLSGGGAIDVAGGTFSSPGGSSGFTGSLQLQGGQVTPTLTVTDAGGVSNGSPFAATALLTAVGTPPAASLQGVSPTFTYYTGSTATGTPLVGAPSAIGTYTVVANFAGSADYAAASSDPVTFSIVPATSSHTVIHAADLGGVFNGKPHPATGYVADPTGKPIATPVFTYYLATDTRRLHPLAGAPSAPGSYYFVATFAGNSDYLPSVTSAPFTISKAPTVIHTADLGGVFNGKPHPATGYVADPTGKPIATPVFTYYLATDTRRLHPLAGAPSAPGSYYFVATFAGNSDYLPSVTSAPFTISKAPTVIHTADLGGVFNGKPHPATGYVADPTGKPIATPVFTYYLATDTRRLHPLVGAPSAVGSYYFVATFAGNSDYLPSVTSAPFTISKAPTVIHTADLGGVFNGKPHPATGYVADPTGKPIATPVFTYYLATDTRRLHPLVGAPSAVGSYYFVATFAGNSSFLPSITTAPFMITMTIK